MSTQTQLEKPSALFRKAIDRNIPQVYGIYWKGKYADVSKQDEDGGVCARGLLFLLASNSLDAVQWHSKDLETKLSVISLVSDVEDRLGDRLTNLNDKYLWTWLTFAQALEAKGL